MHSVRPPAEVDQAQPLTRAEAEVVGWTLYGTDAPSVVELLLLAHNPDAATLKRYAASMALEWFDPAVDLPHARDDDDESEPVKLLKTALMNGDMAVRIAAGDELARMLAPSNVWATAQGGR